MLEKRRKRKTERKEANNKSENESTLKYWIRLTNVNNAKFHMNLFSVFFVDFGICNDLAFFFFILSPLLFSFTHQPKFICFGILNPLMCNYVLLIHPHIHSILKRAFDQRKLKKKKKR